MGGADVVWTAHGHGNDVRAAIVFVLFTAQRAVFRSFTAVSSDRSLAGIVQPYCPHFFWYSRGAWQSSQLYFCLIVLSSGDDSLTVARSLHTLESCAVTCELCWCVPGKGDHRARTRPRRPPKK